MQRVLFESNEKPQNTTNLGSHDEKQLEYFLEEN